MIVKGYLTINNKGTTRFTKTRCGLNWNEISIKICLDIPDVLFQQPLIEAKLKIDRSIIPEPQPIEAILNTKELIEQSIGAKINFKVVPYEDKEEKQSETKPDMTDWDDAPKQERQYKSLDKKRIITGDE